MDISVIICTHNRSAKLRELLASVARVEVPAGRGCEVIVVNNRSTDDTATLLQQTSLGAIPLRVVDEPTPGLSFARNTGATSARGAVVAFLDDDALVTPHWLAGLLAGFDQYDAGFVCGRVLIASNVVRPGWWHEKFDAALGECDHGDRVKVSTADPWAETFGIGCNMAFRRDLLLACGGFTPEFGRTGRALQMGDDVDMMLRVAARGGIGVYAAAALVYHSPSLERFTRHYLRRWYMRIGEFDARQDEHALHRSRYRLALWSVKNCARNSFAAIGNGLRGRAAQSMLNQAMAAKELGLAVGYLKGPLFPGAGAAMAGTRKPQAAEQKIG